MLREAILMEMQKYMEVDLSVSRIIRIISSSAERTPSQFQEGSRWVLVSVDEFYQSTL